MHSILNAAEILRKFFVAKLDRLARFVTVNPAIQLLHRVPKYCLDTPDDFF